MINLRKIILTAGILLACIAAVKLGREILAQHPVPAKEARFEARSKGNPKADIWITEYIDFQCKSCRGSVEMLKNLLEKHPGKIYLQVRYYPLIHNHLFALKSAIYADCAAQQKKFWPMYESLFLTQPDWPEDPARIDDYFRSLAAEAGIHLSVLDRCVEDPKTKETVLTERENAKSLGINTTPTFFVNEKKIVGLLPFQSEMQSYFPSQEEKDA